MKRRIFGLILSAVLMIGFMPENVFAGEYYETELFNDVKPGPDMEVLHIEMDGVHPTGRVVTGTYFGADSSYWGKYASWTYYNKLNSAQKALYDEMYNTCMKYLTGTAAIEVAKNYNKNTIYTNVFDYFSATGLSESQMMDTIKVFVDANPQFFFIKGSGMVFATINGRPYVTTNFFTEYRYGTARSAAASVIKTKVDGWNKTVAKASGQYEKAKAIHDIIINSLTYDHAAAANMSVLGNYQNINTAIFSGKAVCAGYSELYEMLARAAGLECTTVTYSQGGIGHEWNQVNIGGNWYNLDCTWDDNDDGRIYTTYFLKSDATFNSLKSHRPESFYEGIRPKCSYNWGSAPSVQVKEPVSSVVIPSAVVTGKLNSAKNKITVTAGEIAGLGGNDITSVKVKIWSKKNGSDDIKTYSLSKKSNNEYKKSINLKAHKDKGTYYYRIYLKLSNGKTYKFDKKTFKR